MKMGDDAKGPVCIVTSSVVTTVAAPAVVKRGDTPLILMCSIWAVGQL